MSSAVSATPAPAVKPTKFTYDFRFIVSVVRTLYQDADFAFVMSAHLDPELFENKSHRWVVEQIFKHQQKYGAHISEDALHIAAERAVQFGYFRKEEVDGFADVIDRLGKSVPDRTYVKDEVFNFVKSQKLKMAIYEAANCYETNDLPNADRLLTDYLNFSQAPRGLGHFYLRDVKKRIMRRKHHVQNGVPTDTPLDAHTDTGGLPPKHLGVVIAPPGKGKSLFLVHLARSAILHNCQALYVTLELSEEKILDRIDASVSDLYISQLRKKSKELRGVVDKLRARFAEALVVKEFESLSVQGLQSYLRQLERVSFYPDVILVDFADYMEPRVHYEDAYTELGVIYKDLRDLARSQNVAIWTASQGNRESVDAKTVGLKAMADSFKKAGLADFVVGLSQTPKEKRLNKARLNIAKSRIGATGSEVEVTINTGKQKISSH